MKTFMLCCISLLKGSIKIWVWNMWILLIWLNVLKPMLQANTWQKNVRANWKYGICNLEMFTCTVEQVSAFWYSVCVCLYMLPWKDISFMQLHSKVQMPRLKWRFECSWVYLHPFCLFLLDLVHHSEAQVFKSKHLMLFIHSCKFLQCYLAL